MNDEIVIPESELHYRFSTSGGPGGQHANRSATRVDMTFDIAESPSIPAPAKSVLVDALGEQVTVSVDDSRSQWRNRQLAKRRLADKLLEALKTQRVRRPTRPKRSAKRKRVESKRHRSEIKQLRRRPTSDD
ncbi:MAG: aminoacyl-tRNA hydrolase [Acidimicrobiia bacterium]|nr:aminoacyl-tRNA hydrolase [Acidimicrobiia bacterium]